MPRKVYKTRSSSIKAKVKYTTWTNAMDNCLTKILAEQAKEGYKGENIKSVTYDAAIRVINEKFGLELNKDHIKNRLKTLKKQYAVLSGIVAQRGFKWDKARKMVVANDASWKEYIKVNPDAKILRDKTFENYDELGIIVGSDKELASSGSDTQGVDLINENFETAIDPEIQNDEKQTKNLRWTEQMDTCLGKILTEQVQKGYKVGNTLYTEAYEAAVRALNKECGPGFTKEHIKNRLKTWKKQYSILNELFSHDGFKWDAIQRMIVGDDSLWDDYIKMNPEAKYLRGRCIENYDALHLILGNDSTNRCWSTTGEKGDVNLAPCNEENIGTRLPDIVEEMSLDNTCEGTQGSSQQTRARPSSSSRSKQATKKRSSSEAMVEVMRAVAVNIGRIADALTVKETVHLDEIFQMVKNIPGFDDDLIIEACEFLSFDEKRAKMFLKLDERLRKLWLLKRLRAHRS